MKDESCAYCGDRKLADAFGIKLIELPASKVYLFREQSHPGRIIVASKRHGVRGHHPADGRIARVRTGRVTIQQ